MILQGIIYHAMQSKAEKSSQNVNTWRNLEACPSVGLIPSHALRALFLAV